VPHLVESAYLRNLYTAKPKLVGLFICSRVNCRVFRSQEGNRYGFRFRRGDRGFLRLVRGVDPVLRQAHARREQVMNWVYWLSGIAALLIFLYLLIALFKPELFS
jgi:hypothetical protein